jgi:hypothetical protein
MLLATLLITGDVGEKVAKASFADPSFKRRIRYEREYHYDKSQTRSYIVDLWKRSPHEQEPEIEIILESVDPRTDSEGRDFIESDFANFLGGRRYHNYFYPVSDATLLFPQPSLKSSSRRDVLSEIGLV